MLNSIFTIGFLGYVFLCQVSPLADSFFGLFVGLDMWKDQEVLRTAYHDKQGITALFIKNGMRNALALLGHEVSPDDEASWVYEVDINEHLRQVEMFIKFPVELTLPQHQIHIQ
jgi:uncharacterized SAM-dependent methyltransferase